MPLSTHQIKRKLFWYDCNTGVGVILAIAFGTAFAFTGVAEVFAGLFIFYWYIRRLRNRKLYEASLGVGRLHEVLTRASQVLQGAQEFRARELTGVSKLCRTCQNPYIYADQHCTSLREIYPHRPCDLPPNPNPYEWCWHVANGYLKPPPNWPKDLLYADPMEPDLDAMRDKARPYYERCGNPLWDMGYGNIPDWYRAKKSKTN
jgi:hypothetical protein